MNPKIKARKTPKKTSKTFYVSVYSDGTCEAVYDTEEDVKGGACSGDIIYKVQAVKKFKLVDESVKLVEIK